MGVTAKVEKEELEKTVVHFACIDGGDGSVSVQWYRTGEEAEKAEEEQDEGWGEPCTGSVETYKGSDIHKKAIKNV